MVRILKAKLVESGEAFWESDVHFAFSTAYTASKPFATRLVQLPFYQEVREIMRLMVNAACRQPI